ncbi:hypothetical protein AAF712_013344 [Marasmius tenuissimus]|uniref:Tyrosine specific protein phosphatases domain-containing protein n=1 Tax=Marasmius tenuissimus TaxID=585030 RepID=A0ABR2ZHC2_9AGAR|nr:hypothetical protein PM082_005772 [Marasmius tenuissimus]
MEELEALEPSYVQDVLSRPPFVTIDGVINVRDLGGYSTSFTNKMTRPRMAFRSAELAGVTDRGKQQMKDLGITTVFDLRSDTEIEKYNSSSPSIDGVNVVRTPVFSKEDYSPEMMAKRYQLYASGKTEAFMELYSQILDHGGVAFGSILRHVRDRPNEGFMFHCTAGKDRTGVIAAIILKLAGVDDQSIAEDYALTRVGREPARAKILERLAKEPLFASNNEAALNMFTCRLETMTAFLGLLQDKYGGVEEYLKNFLNLSDSDIQVIRRNILSPGVSSQM